MVDALLIHRKKLLVIGLVSLFGSGLLARVAVPLEYTAELRLDAPGREAPISLSARAPTAERALELVRDAGERFIREADARFAGERAASYRMRDEAQRAVEHARVTLAAALAGEGVANLGAESGALEEQIRERERDRSLVLGEATEAGGRTDVLRAAALGSPGGQSSEELVAAQRALSIALAQESRDDAAIATLRQRIQRLMARTAAPLSASVSQRAQARAHKLHVAQLDAELQDLRQKRAALMAVRARYADLLAREQQAEQQLTRAEANATTFDRVDARVRQAEKPRITRTEGRALRTAVAVVTPALVLFLSIVLVLLSEVRDLRVMSSRELAYWMRVPVIATSRWPADPARLEALIDELAEAGLEAPGTTLVLASDEHERPLAVAIATLLNARAQRHYRSATGARVTIAQAWKGDLAGAHLRRAAAVADRVLWVVSSGSYRGPALRVRRGDVPRAEGVAALLVDVPQRHMPSQIGDVAAFWASESSYTPDRLSQHSERVPLH
jgi:hypothetical protein